MPDAASILPPGNLKSSAATRITRRHAAACVALVLVTCPAIAAGSPPARGGRAQLDAQTLQCTRARAAGDHVQVLISTFNERGVYRFAVAHLHFARFPADFFTNANAEVTFHVWRQQSNGRREVRPRLARVFLYDGRRQEILRRAPVDRLSKDTLRLALAMSGIEPTAERLHQPFDHFSILLSDVDETWEGLTIEVHASGDAPSLRIDALLPPVAADAGAYAATAEGGDDAALPLLHPGRNAESICAAFDAAAPGSRATYIEVERPYIESLRNAAGQHPGAYPDRLPDQHSRTGELQ